MFQAKDIMTTPVVAVDLDDTIDRAISLMVKHRISGLPVLDKQGRPVGIVSEFDLLALICEGQTIQAEVHRYMSAELHAVTEEDSWVDLADIFQSTQVRRLPVLRDGKLVGIVTCHDLMHAIRDARQQIREKLSQLDQSPTQADTETVRAAARQP
jgi:CBS domain-containing protein